MADQIVCQSQFGWMNNSRQQTPCLVAAWLVNICEDPQATAPAGLAPLANTSGALYFPPNGSSATTCSCSWAFYNTLMACTVCQGFDLQPTVDTWSNWSTSCGLLGKLSSVLYWPSDQPLAGRTSLPRWSILNAISWKGQIFNAQQAQEIANQNLSDVTDSTAPQPTLSSSSNPSSTSSSHSSAPAGAIAGGVAGGVFVLGLGALLLWYLCYYRKRARGAHLWRQRAHVDLNAEEGEKPLESPPMGGAFPGGMGVGMGVGMYAANATPYDPYAVQQQQQQMQMQQGYATYPGAPGFAPTTLQNANTNMSMPPSPPTGAQQQQPVTLQTYPVSSSGDARSQVPSVAERLSEKQRLREERTRGGGGGRGGAASSRPSASVASASSRSATLPPGAFPGAMGVDETGVLMYTGQRPHHLRGSSSVSGLSGLSAGSASMSVFHSHSQTHLQTHAQTQTHSPSASQSGSGSVALRKGSLDSGLDGQKQQQGQTAARSPTRRFSLTKKPWNRRRPAVSEPASSVVGDAEDVGDFALALDLSDNFIPDDHNDNNNDNDNNTNENGSRAQSPTSPASTRRAAVEDVLATVPGARMPSARDREQPPPSYALVSVPAATDVALFALAGGGGRPAPGRRMTVMNENGDREER